MSARHHLGRWCCRSGNSVDVYLEPDDGSGARLASCEWDVHPISDGDFVDWHLHIRAAVTKRLQSYLERPGPAVVTLHLPLDALGIGPDQPYELHDLVRGTVQPGRGPVQRIRLDPDVDPAFIFAVRAT